MTRIEFLQKQIEIVEYKIIEELESEYNQNGLEDILDDYTMSKLRGYFFMKNELEREIENEKYKECEFY